MKRAYIDVLIPAFHYFAVLNRGEFLYEWVIPGLITGIALLAGYFLKLPFDATFLKQYVGVLVNLLAILVGFTITSVAVFVTIDMKKDGFLSKMSERRIYGSPITWYHFIYLNLVHGVITGIVLLGLSLASFLLLAREVRGMLPFIFIVLTFGTAHLLLLSMRNITNLYFAFFEGTK
ncbi:MAG: hypothetical protein A4E63_00234 [Syntrophorhabdus sp. PtaU1.Bin050]|jgi:hypothetical protein|nr:MAG: hypothetical protein A4E63_00234 [Syntrophorhabdus sp. PtaU1.Bin050]